MNDEQLISLLRAGAESAPPAETDIARAQVVGRRMRRRRHAAAAAGSGLTVAGFVALLTLVGPGGQSVVQSTLPASQTAPTGPTTRPPAAEEACSPTQGEQIQNTVRLREILGSADWQLVPGDTGSCLKTAGLSPTARSAVLAALPAGDSVSVSVNLNPDSTRTNACPAPAKNGPPMLPCTTRQSADGHTVVIERVPLAVSPASGQSHGGSQQGTSANYVRPDGTLASVAVQVEDPDVTPARSHQVDAWLDSFTAKMTDAVTDPALSDAVTKQVSSARAADASRFRDHLGPDGWQFGHNGETTFNWLEPVPGSAVAAGLPAGYGADTKLETNRPGDPAYGFAAYGKECDAFVNSDTNFEPCTTQQTPDGKTVRIQQQRTMHPASDYEVWDAIRVVYTRPDGSNEMVQLEVNDSRPTATTAAARQKQAIAWLNTYLDKLIATATDPAIGTAQPAANQ